MGQLPEGLRDALADRYTIERELGRGGMATVYLARDLRHDRPVALKVLHPELAVTLGPERFQREIRLAARLQHPHILTVFDSGESAGQLWFTMSFVEGESLRDRLTREVQLPVAEAVRLTREVAQALDFAHRHGVIHRDVKPENILLVDGQPLVADFGIARAFGARDEGRLTKTGMAVGTPAYMSPEQAAGEAGLDGRTDIYGLATVLYEMLAGEIPFPAPTAQAMIARRLTEAPRPLPQIRETVSEALDQVVRQALAKAPADRFATVADFAEALAASTSASVGASSSRLRQTRRVPLALTLALGFVLGLGALFGWLRSHGSDQPRATGAAKLLAVLPFENLGSAGDEYFADGITDEVRGKLATLGGLEVIASSSAGQYKRSTKTPRQIAQELGVQYLLVGKIRWEKQPGGQSRVRVSPELIQLRSGAAPTTKWQQPFDAALTDVFQVQADIAGRVAQELDIALRDSTQAGFAGKPTRNLSAYDAYLKGMEAYQQGTLPATLRTAVSAFEQAVALDTTYAIAWARLSQALSVLSIVGVAVPQMAERARIAAERAIALAPDGAEGHTAMGDYYRRVRGDYQRALDEYAQGERRSPPNAELYRARGQVEMALGHWEAALEHLRRAERLDPRSTLVAEVYSGAALWFRRYPEALASAERWLALLPGDPQPLHTKAMILLAQGDLTGARALIEPPPKDISPTLLAVYFAVFYELFWVLSEEQQKLLMRLPPSEFENDRGSWGLALAQTAALRGDPKLTRIYADSARIAFQEQVRSDPNDAQRHALLGVALAYLGRKAEAIRQGQESVALQPLSANAVNAPYLQHQLVRIYILVGEPEKALDQLEALLRIPYYVSPGWLKVDPTFDPLRRNPRFQKLIGESQ